MVKIFENEGEGFVGSVQSVVVRPSQLEGIEQNEYYITILSEDEKEMFEWVAIGQNEDGENICKSSELELYIQEIVSVFPETSDLVYHKEVFEYLIGKKVRWVRKVLGKVIKNIPAKRFLVPRKLFVEEK